MEEFYLIDPPTTAGTEKGFRKTTTGKSVWPDLDLFNHWNRKIGYSAMASLLKKAWRKAPHDTIKLLFHLRNCHGGKGERRQFYKGVRWFMEHHPEQILANFQLIPQFGYWKDLLNIWDSKSELLRAYIVFAFCKQLETDYQSFLSGTQPSLAVKWAPTEKGAADRKWGFVSIFCEQLGWSRKIYRQRVSQMRDALSVTERLASDQRWGEMDFSEIPAKSRAMLHQTLQKWCGKRYSKWCLKHQRREIRNAAYDVVASEYVDSEWRELLQGYQWFSLQDTVCVCDTSPSMDHTSGSSPLNVAMALTMLVSTCSGEYRNKVITFSDTPEIVDIGSETPSQQIQNLKRLKWGYSIDIKAVLNLFGDQMPKQVFILTDRSYSTAQFPYRFDWDYDLAFKDRETPQIYFWNLGGRWGSYSFDLEHHDKGLIIINGFTHELFNSVIKTGHLYPWVLLRQLLSSKEYSKIKLI